MCRWLCEEGDWLSLATLYLRNITTNSHVSLDSEQISKLNLFLLVLMVRLNWKGFRRKWSWLNRSTTTVFLDGLRKLCKSSVRIASVPAEIWTEHQLITGLKRCRYFNPLGKQDMKQSKMYLAMDGLYFIFQHETNRKKPGTCLIK